jgi:glycosyltransferase involved in cell wall biosynthesis
MRIGYVLVGNPPFWQTGYGNQLDLLGESLARKGCKVAHICDWGYAGPMMRHRSAVVSTDVRVYPVSEYPGTLRDDDMRAYVSHFCAEEGLDDVICIYLGDVWKWNHIATVLPNTICLCPVDGSAIIAREVMVMSSFDRLAAMSKYGAGILEEHTGQEILYFPHGYDDRLLDITQSKRAIRARWEGLATAGDQFIVGYFGDFSERKEPELNLLGYRKFLEQIGDEAANTLLYIKAKGEHPQSLSPEAVIGSLGLPRELVQEVPMGDLKMGLSVEQVGRLLRGIDVLLHCSSQEGFGLFQIEAQAVGTPVINTEFGPMPELNACEDLVVPVGSYRTANGVQYGQPDSDAIAERLLMLYEDWKVEMNDSEDHPQTGRSSHLVRWAWDYSYPEVFREHIWPQLQAYADEISSPRVKTILPRDLRHVALVSTYGIECGIATYTNMLAEELVKCGYEVSIIAEVTEEQRARVEPYDSESHSTFNVYRCWDRKYEDWGMAKSVLAEIQPDILHLQHEWAIFSGPGALGIRGLLASADCHRSITWHTPDFLTMAPSAGDDAVLTYDSIVDLHITHNKSKSKMMAAVLNNGVTHIPHGVKEIQASPGARAALGIPENVPFFFAYGFLSGSKGTHVLLEAAVKAAERGPYFELVAYGGHHANLPSSHALYEMCESIAAGKAQVHFIPETISEEDLDEHAQACDFFCFPYMGEVVVGSAVNSSSGAVFRVIGSGKPVIATDEGRLRDLVGGVHGWKVGQGDVDAMADAISEAAKSLHTERYAEMAGHVADFARTNSWKEMGRRHIEAYQKVCGFHAVHATVAMRVVPFEHGGGDFMDAVELASSTGSEEE